MGIQGLLPFIDSVAVDRHLSDFAGQTAAIDGYFWLRARSSHLLHSCTHLTHHAARRSPAHRLALSLRADKGAKRCPMEMARGSPCTGFVDFCMNMVGLLRRHGVEPYVVLDGARLPAKAATEKERRDKRARHIASANALLAAGFRDKALVEFNGAVNITPEHAYQLIHALRLARVRYVVAPYEADAQIALLARRGLVDLVIAEDSDMLAFGCPRVFLKMDAQGSGRFLERQALRQARDDQGQLLFVPWEDWDAGDRLLEMCILNGCDYLSGMSGFGLKTAHKYLRKHQTIETVLRVLEMEGREPPKGFSTFARYVQQVHHALQTFRHQRVFDPISATVVPLTPPPPNVPEMPHCGAPISSSLAHGLCAAGDLSPDTHQQMSYPGMPAQPPPYVQLILPNQSAEPVSRTTASAGAATLPLAPPPSASTSTSTSTSTSSAAMWPAALPGGFATAASLGFSTAAGFRLRPQLPPGTGRTATAMLVQSRLPLAPKPASEPASGSRSSADASLVSGEASGSSVSAAADGKRPHATREPEFADEELPPSHVELLSKPSARQPFKKPRLANTLPPSAASVPSPVALPSHPTLRRSPFFPSSRPMAAASPMRTPRVATTRGPPDTRCPPEFGDALGGAAGVGEICGGSSTAADAKAVAAEAMLCAHSFTPNDRRASLGSSAGMPTLKAMPGTRSTPGSRENAPHNGSVRTPGAGLRFSPWLTDEASGLTHVDLDSFCFRSNLGGEPQPGARSC